MRGQPDIAEGAWLLALVVRPEITKDHVDDFIREISSRKRTSQQSLYRHGKYIESIINKKNKEGRDWAQRQAYLALDVLLAAARTANAKVKTLEGIDPASLDTAIGITEKGLYTLVAVVITPSAPHLLN